MHRVLLLFAGALWIGACGTSRFERYIKDRRWTEAALEVTTDSSLLKDEHALFRAALLYSSPDRETYDPLVASVLLERLLERYPRTHVREDAHRLWSLLQVQMATAAERDAQRAEARWLRHQVDSTAARVATLEADLRARDDQLRALRDELRRLKEIDLRPRDTTRVQDSTAGRPAPPPPPKPPKR